MNTISSKITSPYGNYNNKHQQWEQSLLQISNSVGMLCGYECINNLWAWLLVLWSHALPISYYKMLVLYWNRECVNLFCEMRKLYIVYGGRSPPTAAPPRKLPVPIGGYSNQGFLGKAVWVIAKLFGRIELVSKWDRSLCAQFSLEVLMVVAVRKWTDIWRQVWGHRLRIQVGY